MPCRFVEAMRRKGDVEVDGRVERRMLEEEEEQKVGGEFAAGRWWPGLVCGAPPTTRRLIT